MRGDEKPGLPEPTLGIQAEPGSAALASSEETSRRQPASSAPQPAYVESGSDPKPPSDFTIYEESLVIKPWESRFAERLFSLIPTPRAAKRFSNIYRILKAPLRREDLDQFEGTLEVLGNFQVPMLLLAILVGAPTEAAELFPRLQEWSKA